MEAREVRKNGAVVYVVNSSYYVIVPDKIEDNSLHLFVDENVNDVLRNENEGNLGVVMIAKQFEGLSDSNKREVLGRLLDNLIKEAETFLKQRGIPFRDNIVLNSSVLGLKDWFNARNEKNKIVEFPTELTDRKPAEVEPLESQLEDNAIPFQNADVQTVSTAPETGQSHMANESNIVYFQQISNVLKEQKAIQEAEQQEASSSERSKVLVKKTPIGEVYRGEPEVNYKKQNKEAAFVHVVLLSIITFVVTVGMMVAMTLILT